MGKRIQIKNKKEPYIDIFNGKKLEKQDKKTAIQNIITTKKDIMDDFVEEYDETKDGLYAIGAWSWCWDIKEE